MTQPLTDSQFSDNVLKSKGLVLIDFWAEWCGPCRQLGPILEAIDNEIGNEVKIYKMNVDDSPETASQFGIRSIPTMFLFKDGKQVDMKVGLNTQSTIQSWIESYK
ncbi:MAG: thioredoxin [Alphaproteobacteria bacterium]|nr:thioredoxin [Alphaproteobacteria bacterium]